MKRFLFIILMLNAGGMFAQNVGEPVDREVYSFLTRLAQKSIITYHDEVKPLSRKEIASLILAAAENQDKLTVTDKEYLQFYTTEFKEEIELIKGSVTSEVNYFLTTDVERRRIFSYSDSLFSFKLDPVLGYSYKHYSEGSYTHRWSGLRYYGYIKPNIGFNIDFRDNQESGVNLDRTKYFTPKTGVRVTSSGKQSIQFEEVHGSLSYSWKWGTVAFAKEFINWGSGLGGQLIFSSKAPSFPFIKLDVNPVDWMRFTYIHGWLQSGVLDSSSLRYTLVTGRNEKESIPKFIAAHIISFDVTKKLTLSIGESVVYSREIKPIYLLPVMFFRMADHYMSDSANSGSNAQIFANGYYYYTPLKAKVYGTLFIDELSVEGILEKKNSASALAYTLGVSVSDPFIPNSDFTLEYSRLNPFVYMNSNNAQLFTNHGYQLGHWIGSNADQVYFSYTQSYMRGLKSKAAFSYVRKGSKELPIQQYQLPYPPFLFGSRTYLLNADFTLQYEIIHDLFASVNYSIEKPSGSNALGLAVYFGL